MNIKNNLMIFLMCSVVNVCYFLMQWLQLFVVGQFKRDLNYKQQISSVSGLMLMTMTFPTYYSKLFVTNYLVLVACLYVDYSF